MITTFIINMLKDVQKREKMKRQLQKQNDLEICFIEAIEGKKLSNEQISKLADYPKFKDRYGDFATLPALGCSLSHLSVYKKIIDSQIKSALILEDDAILSANLAKQLEYWINFIQKSDKPIVILLTPDFRYKKGNLIDSQSQKKLYQLDCGFMTSGYLINNQGCVLLYKKLRPVSYFADEWSEFCKMGINLYGIVPHIISYSGELGEIGLSQHSQKRSFWQIIRYKLANIKGFISRIMSYAKGYRRSKRLW